MIQFSHDPEVGTLYFYFTELDAGQAVYEMAYPAALLLDRNGQILGLRFAFDDEVTLDQLELILEDERNQLDMASGYLYVNISDETPADVIPMDDTAIFDLDDAGRVLGVDVAVPADWRTPERLARLAPHMVALDDASLAGEGPIVFQPAPAPPEDETAETAPPVPPVPAVDEAKVGFVALVGKPNVGKSTLLNALLGQKVAIVSPRPQTTRVPLRGILNRPDAQIVFIDTPGIHEPHHKLGQFMVELARRSIPNADVVCFMVDLSMPPSKLDERIAAQVRRARAPRLLVLNKVDLRPKPTRENPRPSYLDAYRALGPWDLELAVSARSGAGLPALLDAIVARLPLGRRLYPEEQVADQSEQQLAAELVREKALRFTEQEVPHAVAVEVEEWEEKDAAIYIRMTINVEKEGQKGILIGSGGEMLKRIGSAARQDIERMLNRMVYLDLWVKVRPNWRDDTSSLGWLGYRLKDWQ